MYFSCKISHSILTYLEREGNDTGFIYDLEDLPHEFLRDPSYWLEAEEMEIFLEEVVRHCVDNRDENRTLDRVIEDAGRYCYELSTWGVLNSVLKIMENPRDVWMQPEKFLSYFIAPGPPVNNFISTEESFEFDAPVSSEQFPYSTSFLASAFESLPFYICKDSVSVSWQGCHLFIRWQDNQKSLFPEENSARNMSPELMRSIVAELEAGQKTLENRNRELLEKNQELLEAKERLERIIKGDGSGGVINQTKNKRRRMEKNESQKSQIELPI